MSNFHQLEEIPVHDRNLGKLQILAGKQSMVLWGKIDAGGHVPKHSHPNEQIVWLVSGKLEYVLGTGEEQTCEGGTVLVVQGGVEHEVWYREDCEIVEFYAPPRTDMFPSVSATNPYGIE